MTDSQQQFCLRWNNFQANITSQFEALRDDEDFVDVTLACDGRRLQAHKVVLSACSPYFKELFKVRKPSPPCFSQC
ncbi:PREDICTED: broad-complex core protein isoforms 1/2/3/4/5-like [Eufriesea mexicana]|uniref:broad-complex core protein isoforms 1/2/3/4/5-like n=1 Tax=Eufriesea mexicana TaxID=516756 RepID=UPI00083C4A41|nr:PREDICTED: broad-complex core protein isoforms 1/2/3/4/5-like [Eufriesea mexicana]